MGSLRRVLRLPPLLTLEGQLPPFRRWVLGGLTTEPEEMGQEPWVNGSTKIPQVETSTCNEKACIGWCGVPVACSEDKRTW